MQALRARRAIKLAGAQALTLGTCSLPATSARAARVQEAPMAVFARARLLPDAALARGSPASARGFPADAGSARGTARVRARAPVHARRIRVLVQDGPPGHALGVTAGRGDRARQGRVGSRRSRGSRRARAACAGPGREHGPYATSRCMDSGRRCLIAKCARSAASAPLRERETPSRSCSGHWTAGG